MIEKIEKLIREINQVHFQFFNDEVEIDKIKADLTKPLFNFPIEHILAYRLNLHESINDYLYRADLYDVAYFYRVKTSESILDKIDRFQQRSEGFPVNSILNDIFGARIIVESQDIIEVMNRLDDWKEKYGLKNWYLRDKEEYIGIHIYFKNFSNFYYPWELQIWDKKDAEKNIQSHRKYKRNFVKNKY